MDDTRINYQCLVEHKAADTRHIISMRYGSRVINPRIMIMRTVGGFLYIFLCFLCFIFFFFIMKNLTLYSGHPFTTIFQDECMGYEGSVVLSKIAFIFPSATRADPIVRGFYLLRLTASRFDLNIFLRQKHARRLRITNTIWVSK